MYRYRIFLLLCRYNLHGEKNRVLILDLRSRLFSPGEISANWPSARSKRFVVVNSKVK